MKMENTKIQSDFTALNQVLLIARSTATTPEHARTNSITMNGPAAQIPNEQDHKARRCDSCLQI